MKIFTFIILLGLATAPSIGSEYDKVVEKIRKEKYFRDIFRLNKNAIPENVKISTISEYKYPCRIVFDNANVADFSSLASCKKLEMLAVKNGKDIDIATIAKIKALYTLECENCTFKNLNALRQMKKKRSEGEFGMLAFINCGLDNQQAKEICDLITPNEIDFSGNQKITSLDFLASRKHIGALRINDTGITDISPLSKIRCSTLEINTPEIQDLSPLFPATVFKLRISKNLKDIKQITKIKSLRFIAFDKGNYELVKDFLAKINAGSPQKPELPSISPKEFEEKKDEEKYTSLQKDAKDKVNFEFSDVKKDLVIIEHEKGCGSGFIAKDEEGNAYIYTNQHVVFGAKKLKFKTVTGEQLKPIGFDLSQERDIIRFKLKEYPYALNFNASPKMDAPVAVFGNSAGGGVATEIYGKVTGIGADRIEVSARFVQGNSGSPVFDKNKRVLGMATYVTRALKKGDWVKKGTRFEKTRYYAYRIDKNIKWKKMKWKIFQRLGQKIMNDRDGIKEIFTLAKTWATAPYTNINDDEFKQQDIRTWIKKHNSMAKKHLKQKTKGVVRNARKLSQINKAMRDDLEENYQSLSALCDRRCKAIKFKTQRYEKYLTKYMSEEISQNQTALKFLGGKVEEIGAKIATTDAFYLRNEPSYYGR